MRRATNRTHAHQLRREILRELDDRGAQTLNASRMTFADLAKYFEEHYLKPAEYLDGRKIEGVRSLKPALAAVHALKNHFGRRRLQSIRYSDLRAYRAVRLKAPTRSDVARHQRELKTNKKAELKVTRTIATVNRELSKLRRMLNIAQREGWIKQNPFAAGESLISLADERKRERILSNEEERRLLKACSTPAREHLRPDFSAMISASLFGTSSGEGKPMAGGLLQQLFGGLFGGHRASGGPVSAGRLYMVGENGPELLAMGGSGHVYNRQQIAQGGGEQRVMVYFGPQELGRALSEFGTTSKGRRARVIKPSGAGKFRWSATNYARSFEQASKGQRCIVR